jgi:DNA mismatch repair ATPase MutS
MGKFYEMFEMDAHIGAKDLDLQYMKVSICESGCFFDGM